MSIFEQLERARAWNEEEAAILEQLGLQTELIVQGLVGLIGQLIG